MSGKQCFCSKCPYVQIYESVFTFVLFQIESAWVENFAEAYAEGISGEDMDLVMQELVSKVRCRKLSFPGVPRPFREFMVCCKFQVLLPYRYAIYKNIAD